MERQNVPYFMVRHYPAGVNIVSTGMLRLGPICGCFVVTNNGLGLWPICCCKIFVAISVIGAQFPRSRGTGMLYSWWPRVVQ